MRSSVPLLSPVIFRNESGSSVKFSHTKLFRGILALNPKELVGDMPIAVLMATFPYTPSFSSLGHPHVLAQEDVALASGPEPKGVCGGHVQAVT